ncbi:hypothetical protein M3D63_00745 [Kocuria palustris]|uniref:hypothetical protein n=1 Tax=Kocuria palustris TaxID=71999 RepID=UPI0021A2D0B6|nr:hypothetical protein [Kocuria palustris]MCT1833316.1 hypothetical protein [Kocuria palustris]MDH5150908.1 hypothetical protein [Kocuria palustris]
MTAAHRTRSSTTVISCCVVVLIGLAALLLSPHSAKSSDSVLGEAESYAASLPQVTEAAPEAPAQVSRLPLAQRGQLRSIGEQQCSQVLTRAQCDQHTVSVQNIDGDLLGLVQPYYDQATVDAHGEITEQTLVTTEGIILDDSLIEQSDPELTEEVARHEWQHVRGHLLFPTHGEHQRFIQRAQNYYDLADADEVLTQCAALSAEPQEQVYSHHEKAFIDCGHWQRLYEPLQP